MKANSKAGNMLGMDAIFYPVIAAKYFWPTSSGFIPIPAGLLHLILTSLAIVFTCNFDTGAFG